MGDGLKNIGNACLVDRQASLHFHSWTSVLKLTAAALLVQLLLSSLAAVADRCPSGRGALARVQFPRAVTGHRPVLLVWQAPVVSTATEKDNEWKKRKGGNLEMVHKRGEANRTSLTAN